MQLTVKDTAALAIRAKQIKNTFEDVSLEERGIKLKRLITILDHMLVKLQLTITKRSITEIQNN